MGIRVNYNPAPAAIAPAAYQAGFGQYTQRQQAAALEQGNRDRNLAFQQQQAALDRAFSERQQLRQAALQERQMQQQAAYRQQAQQQELLGNAMQQQMSLAAQAQQMQMRQAANQQEMALKQQQLTQEGLKDGSLRYSTAQKNQMAKLYSDWDRVNQATNLNQRDRQLAQQELQRQFAQIQPRPVTPDERAAPIAERFQTETFEDPRFPGTRIGVDKTGKFYPISMIPRGTGAGGATKPQPPKNEIVQQPGSGFSLTDPSTWLGAVTGGNKTYGFYDQAGKFHKTEAPKETKSGKPDPQKEATAYYKDLLAQTQKIYAANKEAGMTIDQAKEEAAALLEDHPSNPAGKNNWLLDMVDPNGKLRAENPLPSEPKRETSWQKQQAAAKTISQEYTRLNEEFPHLRLPTTNSVEDQAAILKAFGRLGNNPPQQAPQQTMSVSQAAMAAALDGGTSSNPFLGMAPQQAAPQAQPQQDPIATARQNIIQSIAASDQSLMGIPNPVASVREYEAGNKPVPRPVAESIKDYFDTKFGDSFDPKKIVEPEDQQLLRILQNAAKQAKAESQKNPDKRVQKIPAINMGAAASGRR